MPQRYLNHLSCKSVWQSTGLPPKGVLFSIVSQSVPPSRSANLNAAHFMEKNHHSTLQHTSVSLIQRGSSRTNVHDVRVLLVGWRRGTHRPGRLSFGAA